jgi:hypothetical protein
VIFSLLARSRLIAVVPIGVGLEVPTLLESQSALRKNWTSTLEVANGSAPLLVIVCAVAACAATISWERHQEMLPPLGLRQLVVRLGPALVIAALLSITHVIWVAGVCLLTRSGTTGTLHLEVLLPIPLALLAGALLGAVVGMWSRSWFAVPLVGVALFLALVNLTGGRRGSLVTLGGIGDALTGAQVRSEIVGAQVLWFFAIALAATAALAAGRHRGRLGLPVLALALPILAGSYLTSLGPDRFELAKVDWSCSETTPKLCVLEERSRSLLPLAPRLQAAHARLAEMGGGSSEATYWQRLDKHDPSHEHEVSLRAKMSDLELALAVLAADAACSDEWSYPQYMSAEGVAQEIVGDGLLDGTPTVGNVSAQTLRELDC